MILGFVLGVAYMISVMISYIIMKFSVSMERKSWTNLDVIICLIFSVIPVVNLSASGLAYITTVFQKSDWPNRESKW